MSVSDEEIVARLIHARKVVEAADMPTEMWNSALGLVYQEMSKAPESDTARVKPKPAAEVAGTDEGVLFAKIAKESGVLTEELEGVYFVEEGSPLVAIPSRRLGANLKEQQETVAYLIVGARYFGLDEPEVPFATIRAECQRLKCFDSGNFSTYMRSLPGVVVVGEGTNRRVRLRPAGQKIFADRVSELSSP